MPTKFVGAVQLVRMHRKILILRSGTATARDAATTDAVACGRGLEARRHCFEFNRAAPRSQGFAPVWRPAPGAALLGFGQRHPVADVGASQPEDHVFGD